MSCQNRRFRARAWAAVIGWLCLALLCFLFAPDPANATPPEIPEIDLTSLSMEELLEVEVETVEGASRYRQESSRAPASISIISAQEIKMFGYRNLADIVGSARGIYTPNDRNYHYFGNRGFNRPGDYNGRVLGLLNGHRLNENIFDSLLLGPEEFLDVDLIKKVEIIRGPSSSIYGNNAFFGVVNIISREGKDIGGWESSVAAGSLDTYRGRITYGQAYGEDWDVLLSGSLFETAGDRDIYFPEFDDPATNNGVAENSDEDENYSSFLRIRYRDFTLSGGYSHREKNIPTASFATVFNDGRESSIDARGYVDLAYQRQLTPDGSLNGRAYYDTYIYKGDYPYDYADPGDPPDIVLNVDESEGHWIGTEWQWTQQILDAHTLVGGIEYREHLEQEQKNFDANPDAVYLHDNQTSRNVGTYVQAEFNLQTNLLANIGVRYDHYSSFGGTLNPRAGLIYKPHHTSTLKFLYGQAFRAPNAFELYYESPDANKANPDLDPETIRTYEVILEQQLPHRILAKIAGYYYEVDDLISQRIDPMDGLSFFDNIEHVEAYGLELEAEHRLPSGWLARASYSLQKARDKSSGIELSNSPRHLAKFKLLIPIYQDKIYSGLEAQYMGSVLSANGTRVDDFILVNWTVFAQELLPGLEMSASVYNLLDTDYGYASSLDHLQNEIPQDGISFRVKLTYRF